MQQPAKVRQAITDIVDFSASINPLGAVPAVRSNPAAAGPIDHPALS